MSKIISPLPQRRESTIQESKENVENKTHENNNEASKGNLSQGKNMCRQLIVLELGRMYA
jgi:hypothetical protein